MTAQRAPVERALVTIPIQVEVQRNPDGTWSGGFWLAPHVVLTRPNRVELLQALQELHSAKEPAP